MSRFLRDASEIFDAASAVPEDASAELTILVHSHGQIHIVDGSELPMHALQARHGCETAFRVTRNSGAVRVEGRDGSRRCILENTKCAPKPLAPAAALGVFRDCPLYSSTATLALR